MKEKPRYKKKEDVEKLRNLLDWCIVEDAYLSPTNTLLNFKEDFEIKSVIYPKDLTLMTREEIMGEYGHYCPKKDHYVHEENSENEVELIPEE